MPVGGFDAGANVWVENGELYFYLDRSGCFDENNQALKLGRFHFRFLKGSGERFDPFSADFRQELDLENGRVQLQGKDGFQAEIWFDVRRPVCHMDCQTAIPFSVEAIYESWRTAERELSELEKQAPMSYQGYPERVISYPDVIEADENQVVFYHRNREDALLFHFAMRQQGLEQVKEEFVNPQHNRTFGGVLCGSDMVYTGQEEGTYADVPYTGWVYRTAETETHQFQICMHTEQAETLEEWRQHLEQTVKAAMDDPEAREQAADWWHQYWERSYIEITAEGEEQETAYQVARNYNLFRYMLGCNAYGEYPTKFNCGFFMTDMVYTLGDAFRGITPDFRRWGGGSFTAQNQRLVYWPMLKSGDFDMMEPQFAYYNRLLKNAELRTQEYWGHDGCCYAEQLENFGLPVALCWGFEETPVDFYLRRPSFEHGELRCPWTRYEYTQQLEFAFMILQYYEYTGQDITAYIPFIESCVTFYFAHYTMRNRENTLTPYDANGKLVIYPSTALETYKDATNPADAVSALRAVVSQLAELPQYVDIQKYRELYQYIPELSTREREGKECIAPADCWTQIINHEIPQLYPVFPYEQFGIGHDRLQLAIDTYWHGIETEGQRHYESWHQDNIFAARLGLTEEAKRLTVLKFQDSGRRFPAFWGPGCDWAPDHNWGGSAMIGLQDMLVQSAGNTVYLFPAWPKEWNVRFKLHLPQNTVVEAEIKNGKINYEICSPYKMWKVVLPE